MTVPVFEEYEPAGDCVCPGCAQQRRERARALPVRAGGHPAAHGARRALVLVTAAGAVLSGGGTGALAETGAGHAPVPEPESAGTARPGGEAGAAPAARAVEGRERAAGAHPARAARARADHDGRPELAGTVVPAGSRAEHARADPARTQRARADRVRADDPAGSGRETGPDPETPQGGQGPLHGAPIPGPAGTAGLRKMARADIMNRAKRWVNAKVPYSMSRYWADGYRQDCSGYVSMAWHLPGNEWTGSLAQFGTRIERKDLQPGDILLFHNPSNPAKGSHVTIFGGWADSARTKYIAYEQAKPHTRRQTTPMAYWNNSSQYVAYRYKALKGVGTAGGQIAGNGGIGFPGVDLFGPGEDNPYVARLGRLLLEQGFGERDTAGPGSRWGEAHRQATQAFQRAQGWAGAEADGMPGPDTWRLLVNGTGRKTASGADPSAPNEPRGTVGPEAPAPGTVAAASGRAPSPAPPAAPAPGGAGSAAAGSGAAGPVPEAPPPAGPRKAPAPAAVTGAGPSGPGSPARSVPRAPSGRSAAARPGVTPAAPGAPRKAPAAPDAAASAPGFPGHGHFRPGGPRTSDRHLDTLRRQLAKRGFGRHYSTRPGPRWGDADRRSVEAFQRAQGWRGAAADGYPGPETWRRLFS